VTDTLYDQHALAREFGMRPLPAHCHHHLIARVHHLRHRFNNLCKAVGPLTLALSRRERGQRLLGLQHLLDQRMGFCHVPVREEGER
jgi:hypothetical protein